MGCEAAWPGPRTYGLAGGRCEHAKGAVDGLARVFAPTLAYRVRMWVLTVFGWHVNARDLPRRQVGRRVARHRSALLLTGSSGGWRPAGAVRTAPAPRAADRLKD